MLKIIVSGKPQDFREFVPVAPSRTAASFVLMERRYVNGEVIVVRWLVCVPQHKVKWVKKSVEKLYTVVVEGDDFAPIPPSQQNGEHGGYFLQLSEIHQL